MSNQAVLRRREAADAWLKRETWKYRRRAQIRTIREHLGRLAMLAI